MYDYCDSITNAANNLYNATLFRIRQVMTAMSKNPSDWQENERTVMKELETYLPAMNENRAKSKRKKKATELFEMPTKEKWLLNYYFLDCLFKVSGNADYKNPILPAHATQHAIKLACTDMKSFLSANKEWKKNPSLFTGKPKLPHYKKKGGNCTIISSNQECHFIETETGSLFLKLPKTKQLCCIYKSNKLPSDAVSHEKPAVGRLKQVTITPVHGVFQIAIVSDNGKDIPPVLVTSKRTCHIDFGVNNLAAMTNNIGQPCLLFKGGVVKSANQWYNKQLAKMQSQQAKGTTRKFASTPELQALLLKRNSIILDFMHKVAKKIITWCVANRIDTMVLGINKGWKQDVNLGHKNNQDFVQIPFFKFQQMLSYLCEREGIRVIKKEESYTSRASFLDGDAIPTYGKDDATAQFSGRRGPTHYKGQYRKKGFHGLYRTKDGTIINADLNGSANIGRKALPNTYSNGMDPDFFSVVVCKHPDRRKNLSCKATVGVISKSKQRRLNRKAKK